MSESTHAVVQPIAPEDVPKSLRDIVIKARRAWLRNQEVVDILSQFVKLGLKVSPSAPDLPPSGSLFLFNRKFCRFFRKDGYAWKKKNDNKTVKEVHEKLKLGSKEVLNCYYAHAEDGMQRRCYWLLEEGYDAIVLVHYLNISHTKAARKQGWIQPRPIDPVTGLLPTAPPPPPPSTATSLGRRVSLSFSAEPMVSSHSMTTMTASGSFTITTGHSMVPVAEFRLNSKESLLGKVEGQEESAAEVLHGGDQGRVRHQQPLQSYGVTAAAHGVLPASPFSAQRQDAPGAAPDSPTRVVHGFDPEVLNLNRGGALPSGHGTTPAQLECSQNDAAAGEAQASNLAAAFVARSVRQGSTGLRPSAAFVPYHPGQGGDGSDGSNVGVRRGSQAAVSAFE